MRRLSVIVSMGLLLSAWALPAAGGAANGGEVFKDLVLTPVIDAARWVYVSDGSTCIPDGENSSTLQFFDSGFNPCVPVFVREGTALAKLNGEQTVTTCVLPEGGGLKSLELTVTTVFTTANNPGLLVDLVLPTQTFFGGGIDPDEIFCQNGDPGAEITGTGWFAVGDASCIELFTPGFLPYDGMIIPIDGSQPGPTLAELLVDAGQEVFAQANGFEPVPVVLSASLDGSGNVISTDRFLAPSIGMATLPICAGVDPPPTSERYEIEVLFAQPAGFVPPAVPITNNFGLIALVGCIGSMGWLLVNHRRRGRI